MNTGADVSYLLKARQALKDSEDAERYGDSKNAFGYAGIAVQHIVKWAESIKEKEAA